MLRCDYPELKRHLVKTEYGEEFIYEPVFRLELRPRSFCDVHRHACIKQEQFDAEEAAKMQFLEPVFKLERRSRRGETDVEKLPPSEVSDTTGDHTPHSSFIASPCRKVCHFIL